jgi:hypothetical protein
MESFREYIQQHVDSQIILVEMWHLNTITFDDICILIHLITTQNMKVKFSEAVKLYLNYEEFTQNSVARIPADAKNGEELIILMYLPVLCYEFTYFVEISYYSKQHDDYVFQYQMSNKFTLAAKKYGILKYPGMIRIIANYNIPIEYSTDKANKCIREYMNIQKSAR